MSISVKQWGVTPDGAAANLYSIEGEISFAAHISNYGACLVGLEVPTPCGISDVVLGFDNLKDYLGDSCYFGATIGRTANRISKASFEFNDRHYQLDANEGNNTLHGGYSGFNSRIWTAQACDQKSSSLTLTYKSPDGEAGYPGNLLAEVTFTIIENGLRIEHKAKTDKACPVSMTAHPYFNLEGCEKTLSGHELKILSRQTLGIGTGLVPTGVITDVHGTVSDFSTFTPIDRNSLESPATHDRFYVLGNNCEVRTAAVVRCKTSGIEMEISTTQPGMQFYSGDGIPAGTIGKNGCLYGPRSGFCLEPSGYPDAPNRKEFPSVTLNPGEQYVHSTEYRFRSLNGGA